MKLAYCGDDCEKCPRFQLRDEKKLKNNASRLDDVKRLLIKVGWMRDDFPLDKVPCGGCHGIEHCEYGVKECCQQLHLEHCGKCPSFPCEKITHALEITDQNREIFKNLLTSGDYNQFFWAFFNKRQNLTT